MQACQEKGSFHLNHTIHRIKFINICYISLQDLFIQIQFTVSAVENTKNRSYQWIEFGHM
jgi:hypothetical protein